MALNTYKHNDYDYYAYIHINITKNIIEGWVLASAAFMFESLRSLYIYKTFVEAGITFDWESDYECSKYLWLIKLSFAPVWWIYLTFL